MRRIRIEPGPHGPETHVHIERRKMSREEAERLMKGFDEALRDPWAFFEKGLQDPFFAEALPPEAKSFMDRIRRTDGRR